MEEKQGSNKQNTPQPEGNLMDTQRLLLGEPAAEGNFALEDILEELVGEIWDEHDEVIEIFQKQPDGSFLIACSADLDDMYDLFQVKGTCDAATVSGWVLEQVGRVPEAGDQFQAEGLDVTVTKVEHRRVLEIQVRVIEEEPEK